MKNLFFKNNVEGQRKIKQANLPLPLFRLTAETYKRETLLLQWQIVPEKRVKIELNHDSLC